MEILGESPEEEATRIATACHTHHMSHKSSLKLNENQNSLNMSHVFRHGDVFVSCAHAHVVLCVRARAYVDGYVMQMTRICISVFFGLSREDGGPPQPWIGKGGESGANERRLSGMPLGL